MFQGLFRQPGLLMWTPATRTQHKRVSKRCQTDLSDAEWALVEIYLPEALAAGLLGACHPRTSRSGKRSTAGLPGFGTNA